jgi:hypothetical protein
MLFVDLKVVFFKKDMHFIGAFIEID